MNIPTQGQLGDYLWIAWGKGRENDFARMCEEVTEELHGKKGRGWAWRCDGVAADGSWVAGWSRLNSKGKPLVLTVADADDLTNLVNLAWVKNVAPEAAVEYEERSLERPTTAIAVDVHPPKGVLTVLGRLHAITYEGTVQGTSSLFEHTFGIPGSEPGLMVDDANTLHIVGGHYEITDRGIEDLPAPPLGRASSMSRAHSGFAEPGPPGGLESDEACEAFDCPADIFKERFPGLWAQALRVATQELSDQALMHVAAVGRVGVGAGASKISPEDFRGLDSFKFQGVWIPLLRGMGKKRKAGHWAEAELTTEGKLVAATLIAYGSHLGTRVSLSKLGITAKGVRPLVAKLTRAVKMPPRRNPDEATRRMEMYRDLQRQIEHMGAGRVGGHSARVVPHPTYKETGSFAVEFTNSRGERSWTEKPLPFVEAQEYAARSLLSAYEATRDNPAARKQILHPYGNTDAEPRPLHPYGNPRGKRPPLGSILDNGWIVEHAAMYDDQYAVVMALRPTPTGFHDFAVWHYNTDGEPQTFWGSYHTTFKDAYDDYREVLGKQRSYMRNPERPRQRNYAPEEHAQLAQEYKAAQEVNEAAMVAFQEAGDYGGEMHAVNMGGILRGTRLAHDQAAQELHGVPFWSARNQSRAAYDFAAERLETAKERGRSNPEDNPTRDGKWRRRPWPGTDLSVYSLHNADRGSAWIEPYKPRAALSRAHPGGLALDVAQYAEQHGQKIPKGTKYMLLARGPSDATYGGDFVPGSQRITAHKTLKAAKAAGIKQLDAFSQQLRKRPHPSDRQPNPEFVSPCDVCKDPVSGETRLWDGVSDMWLCEMCFDAEEHGGPLASWWTPEIEAQRHAHPQLWRTETNPAQRATDLLSTVTSSPRVPQGLVSKGVENSAAPPIPMDWPGVPQGLVSKGVENSAAPPMPMDWPATQEGAFLGPRVTRARPRQPLDDGA